MNLPTGLLGGEWAEASRPRTGRVLTRQVSEFHDDPTPPPLATGLESWVANETQFSLTLDGDFFGAASLRRAAGRSGQLFDQVALRLLAITGTLHDNGRHLGLLTPLGVLIAPPSTPEGTPKITLIDLGFHWKGGFVKPNWLQNAEKSEWRTTLWENDQSFDRRVRGEFAPGDEADDLRLLARIFRILIDRGEAGDGTSDAGRPGALTTRAVLRDAEAGRLGSAAEFSQRLQAAPLRNALGQQVDVGNARWLRATIAVGSLVLALGGAGAVWNLAPRPLEPHPFTPRVPGHVDWNAAVEAYYQAGSDPPRQAEALGELQKQILSPYARLNEVRRQALADVAVHFNGTLDLNAAQLVERLPGADAATALPQMNKLLEHYALLHRIRQDLADVWPTSKGDEPWEHRLVALRDSYGSP